MLDVLDLSDLKLLIVAIIFLNVGFIIAIMAFTKSDNNNKKDDSDDA